MTIRVGTIIPGYGEGYFGRDSYEDKRVEAIGADWIVCRDRDNNIHFASGSVVDGKGIIEFLEDYLTLGKGRRRLIEKNAYNRSFTPRQLPENVPETPLKQPKTAWGSQAIHS